MFESYFRNLVDFLFPKELTTIKLESLEPHSLLAKLPQAKDIDTNTVAIWNYADSEVRALIWELKYKKNEKIIKNLSLVLMDVLKSELLERPLLQNFANPLLIPMPMSKQRRLKRGWSQTELLANAIRELDSENLLELSISALAREERKPQTLIKNRKDRAKNVLNSFKALETEVNKRNVILLDDVTTTGATFRDACRALQEAGARKILCLSIAH